MKEIKNFISSEESNELIQFHKKNFNLNNEHCFMHRNTAVMDHLMVTKFTNIEKALTKFVKNINNNYVINYFQIVKWPSSHPGKPLHTDFTRSTTVLSSIIYLNNDFEGGHTFFEDGTAFAPATGRIIFFDGKYYHHGVSEIKKKDRYTVASWFKL